MTDFEVTYENVSSGELTKTKFKTIAKEKAFGNLIQRQVEHTKARQIKYEELKL